jgi:hypothetical protein
MVYLFSLRFEDDAGFDTPITEGDSRGARFIPDRAASLKLGEVSSSFPGRLHSGPRNSAAANNSRRSHRSHHR